MWFQLVLASCSGKRITCSNTTSSTVQTSCFTHDDFSVSSLDKKHSSPGAGLLTPVLTPLTRESVQCFSIFTPGSKERKELTLRTATSGAPRRAEEPHSPPQWRCQMSSKLPHLALTSTTRGGKSFF